ncbi:hypothetical protein LBMAG56_09010 [Verrucomicrobiota bacterium]|nr:hypothetical protein LBMAG56_09010 [Verrucomicrobiota bacterium]
MIAFPQRPVLAPAASALLPLLAAALVAGGIPTAPAEETVPRPALAALTRMPSAPVITNFRFVGNTVFTDLELAELLAPWLNRKAALGELEDARTALTLHYVNAGYVNSGALLDAPPDASGEVTFRIVEGRLTRINIDGARHLRPGYYRSRIARDGGAALHLPRLEKNLMFLKEDPNVSRINAELKPGAVRGTADLDVKVAEKSPWHLAFQVANDRPASVGAESLEAIASHSSVLGWGDALEFRYGIAQRTQDGADWSGVKNLSASYTIPLTPYDTTLKLSYGRHDFAIIEEPFNALDINSESVSYSVTLRQPLHRTMQREIAIGLTGDWRQSKSSLFGLPFSFSPGAINGETAVSVLRFFQEWTERDQKQVLALRSSINFGLEVLDATRNGTARDGKFVSWQGQAQYVRRLDARGDQLVLSGSFQVSDSPLLSLEQFSIGGANTVRGLRENQIVRDMGAIGSIEFRVPVWSTANGQPRLQLAPFFDYGFGWNIGAPTPKQSDVASAGVGLLFNPCSHVSGRLYWGHAFRDFNNGSRDLQDHGLHFSLIARVF